MENDWKNLEIGHIPSDFFVNERYEIEFQGDIADWVDSPSEKVGVVGDLVKGLEDYRYRLKPLESIRITRKMWKAYCNYMGYNVANLMSDGRKVEIIN